MLFDRQNGREQLDSPAALPTPEPTQQAASCRSVAVAALQEEVTALRAEIASLQAQLANFKNQASNQRQQAGSESPRREVRVGSNLTYCHVSRDTSNQCGFGPQTARSETFQLANRLRDEKEIVLFILMHPKCTLSPPLRPTVECRTNFLHRYSCFGQPLISQHFHKNIYQPFRL